ncbi:hypothetical protein CBF23_014580 [Marinomonas agarivorans]|nr:hypothetical protein CBF23_014580 [Marinomonas agarivorans]
MISRNTLLPFFFFSASKSLVFFTPLAVLWLLSESDYVLVEQTFATALLLWPILGLGMTSAYSYFFLEKQDKAFVGFYFQYLALILVVIALVLFGLHIVSDTVTQATHYLLFITFLMCFSYFVSAVYKCNSDVIRSSCFDALPYVGFFVFLLASMWHDYFGISVQLVLLAIIFLTVFRFSRSQQHLTDEAANTLSLTNFSWQKTKSYLIKGIHSLMVGWLAIAVVMFPRVFLADFASTDEATELYLALRFATFFVLIYQFIQIKLYAKIFKIAAHTMRIVLLLYWLIIVLVLVMLILFDITLPYYFAALYTGMWVMVSMLELQIVRRGVQLTVMKGAVFLLPLGLCVLFVDSFYYFLAFSIALLSAYLLVQAYSVYQTRLSLHIMALPIMSAIGLLYYA